jgi:anti-sigma B factor antagonist
MEANTSRKNDIAIIELKGRLDAVTCPKVEEKILSMIDGGDLKLLVDCQHLEYISSAGLRVFYRAAKKLAPLKGRLAFCALTHGIKNVFDVVDMDMDFSIFDTREQAISNFSSPFQQSEAI